MLQTSPKDTQNFDYDFVREPIALTPMAKDVLGNIDQDLFRDFSFTNQVLIEEERKAYQRRSSMPQLF